MFFVSSNSFYEDFSTDASVPVKEEVLETSDEEIWLSDSPPQSLRVPTPPSVGTDKTG